MPRALALLLIGVFAVAEDAPAPAPLPILSFSATRSVMSMAPDRPSEAEGVALRYEAVRLACDRLRYTLAPLAGATRPVLATAELSGGPDGRVLFDTTASQLSEMAFRGVLRPRAVTLARLPVDAASPQAVRFRAEAADLGDVSGVVATETGPRHHVAWADRAVIEFTAEAAASAALGTGAPRLAVIHFYGRPAADGQPARPAVVLRLRAAPPAEVATVAGQLGGGNVGMRASGMTMSLYFDALGQLSGYQNDTGDYEVSDGEDLIPRLGGSRPTLGK